MTMMQVRDDAGRKVLNIEIAAEDDVPDLPAGYTIEPADDTPLWPALPHTVADYQFAGEAEARGFISADECDAWVARGVIPADLAAKVGGLIDDPEERRRVLLFLKGAKEIPREHPNTVALAAMFGLTTPQQIADFFVAAKRR